MFCMELELIGNSQAEVEHYAAGRGLFDESKIERDDDGKFATKGGGSGATIADEPFALGQAKPGKSKGGRHETQGSLFDTELHGAEARDLPGQTNFLGDEPEDTPATSGIDKSDAPSRNSEPKSFGERRNTGSDISERAKMNTAIKKGDRIRLKPEFAEPHERDKVFVAKEDEYEGGTLQILLADGLAFSQTMTVKPHMVERVPE